MKNVKKNIIIFGAAAIVLLMVSSAIAGTVVPQSSTSVNNAVSEKCLSGSEQRQILSDALNYIDKNDNENRILIQEIIKLMDTKGFVTDSDIAQIISANNLGLTAGIWHTISTGGGLSGGQVFHLRPGLIIPSLLAWEAFYEVRPFDGRPFPPYVTVDGYTRTYDHIGFAIGFLGEAGNYFPCGMLISGRALVVIVPDVSNQQSSNLLEGVSNEPSTELSSTIVTNMQ